MTIGSLHRVELPLGVPLAHRVDREVTGRSGGTLFLPTGRNVISPIIK